jgi:chromosomal replication initiation ATPase DnaA
VPPHATQLVLDLPLRPALGRDDFFVSPANEQAVAAIDQWPDWPNRVLIISGPEGSGKSHLCEVWQNRSQAITIGADQLDIESLPDFFKNNALIVENLPGDPLDEKALFHLINMAREQKGFLLLTALQPAASWNIALPDLVSRLAAAGSATIQEPDDALLRAILIKQFADRQINIDESVISYMVARMERSARAARTLVAEIDREALRQKANVTRPFVSGIINKQFQLPDI